MPKRSNQRRRRGSKYSLETTVAVDGVVEIPAASESWHPIARAWFDSLAISAQVRFYEPSDWSYAVVWTEILSRQMEGRPSARMMASWSSAATDLLTTEAARRRVRVEIDRRVLQPVPEARKDLHELYGDL